MLDTDTKRQIDTARDILVGKLPDPKSQIDQITIALIYKFMDDMDAASEELGGNRQFFAKDFSKYGWARLTRSGLSGYEVVDLYQEAIQRMPENPGIPPLFREIFKNANLPYRDPETLRLFLRTIDEFSYDDSERLGDAFEYLLSVMGSQGDAGQFRTPRDIIDFIVEIVDPRKNEVVLDPACGTAGFLISAYKHILRVNRETYGSEMLTPEENARLARNFRGYDISPDMVRMSLVNLYLHNFKDPHVYEYDTLTSEDRWNEYADVILANPPFMSPKGGIVPHTRFKIRSNRSEVLFVDYILEHLTADGRAGIIVPEGIVFQSGTAYRRLREILVNEALIGVVSLPSGVFQPYSGVKTSILILDKRVAKSRPNVLFSTIEAIGVSLGIKRTPVERNDLPQVIKDFVAYYAQTETSPRSFLVDRRDIAVNDFNLNGERYRPKAVLGDTHMVRLKEVCELAKGSHSSSKTEPGPYPLIVTAREPLTSIDYRFEGDAVCVPLISSTGHGRASISRIHFASGKFAVANLLAVLQSKDTAVLDTKFLFFILDAKKDQMAALMKGAANVSMKVEDLAEFLIPLPPLQEQQEIVTTIEAYQKVVDGARTVVDNYRPQISVDPEWPLEPIGNHFTTMSGGTPSKANPAYWSGDIPWVSPKDMKFPIILDTEDHISAAAVDSSATKLLPGGTVVCVVRSGILRHTFPVAMLARDMCINQDLVAFKPVSNELDAKFLFFSLKTFEDEILREGIKPGVTVQSFHSGFFRDYQIPVPDLHLQRKIVADLEAEQALVYASRELIVRFEHKIRGALSRVWGEQPIILTEG